jgi:hypothetical protein
MYAKKLSLVITIVVASLVIGETAVEARAVISENEFKDKIANNKISTIYLIDGAIGGLEINQYGLVSGELIVFGQYKKIPEDIMKLASEHNVSIKTPEGYGSENEVFSSLMMRAMPSFLELGIFLGILIVLIQINRKLSKMLDVWKQKT